MFTHVNKDHSTDKAIHSIFIEHRINRIVLPLGALFVVFLMWAAMMDFALFIKAVVISSVIVYLYFAISWSFSFHDKLKKRKNKKQ